MMTTAQASSGGPVDLLIGEGVGVIADLQDVTGTHGLSGTGGEAMPAVQGASSSQADPLGAIADLVTREGISGEEIEEALTVARFAR